MQLNVGKYYETLDGSIHGPMDLTSSSKFRRAEGGELQFFSKPCGPIWDSQGELVSLGYPSVVFNSVPVGDHCHLVREVVGVRTPSGGLSIMCAEDVPRKPPTKSLDVPVEKMTNMTKEKKPYKTGTYFVSGQYGEVDGRNTVHVRPEGTQIDVVGVQLLRSQYTKKELKAVIAVLTDVVSVMED